MTTNYIPTVRANLREEAYRKLGVRWEDVHGGVQITAQLKQIAAVLRRAGQSKVTTRVLGGGDDIPLEQRTHHKPPYGPGSDVARSWPWYLETADDPAARKVLEAFYSVPKFYRALLPVEAFCVAAHISPMRILELITAACVRVGANASTIVAAVNHPRIVQKTVEMALTDEGHADRTDLHKAVGFLPTPKAAQTSIQIIQNANANAAAAQASAIPVPEATIRKLANRFHESKQIPDSVRIPDVLPDDAEVIEVEDEPEDV